MPGGTGRANAQAARTRGREGGMKAIVVDDSRVARNVVKRILEKLGIECIEAADGNAALEVLKNVDPPALALLDWNMPNMSGYELLKALRMDTRYDVMRIMMCTSETESGQMHKALMAGADDYIMKPFTGDSVVMKLEMLGLAPESQGDSNA
jgi:two-component system chemotaxis response regulator CheY